MFAVVLVGGFGTRLRPLTNDIPKPMLPVVHRPMIVGLVEHLAAAGISDVVLALGFRPGPFESAFVGGRHGDVRLHYAVEPQPLDTGGAIAFAARTVGIDDTFVVANGDVITDLDIAHLIDEHGRFGTAATIHLTPVEDPSAFGVVELGETGRVQRFVEKPEPGETESDLINAGTYVMERSVLDLIEPGVPVSVERDTFQRLTAAGQLAGYATTDYWLDAGRPDQYLRANLDLIRGVRGDPPDAADPTASVAADAVVTDSVISADVVVGAGATVTESVVLPGARVDAGADVRGSIVAGRIGASAAVDRCVVGAGFSVAAGAVHVGQLLPDPG